MATVMDLDRDARKRSEDCSLPSPHLHLQFSRLCLSSAASDLVRCRCREDARGIMCFVSDGRITPTLWPPRQWRDISLVGREGSDKLNVSARAEGRRKTS